MRIRIECTYCAFIWDRLVTDTNQIKSLKCLKCKDRNLKVKDFNKDKVDTYVGCPEFVKPITYLNLDDLIIAEDADYGF